MSESVDKNSSNSQSGRHARDPPLLPPPQFANIPDAEMRFERACESRENESLLTCESWPRCMTTNRVASLQKIQEVELANLHSAMISLTLSLFFFSSFFPLPHFFSFPFFLPFFFFFFFFPFFFLQFLSFFSCVIIRNVVMLASYPS